MKNFRAWVVVSIVFVLAASGCDLLNPPKKAAPVKKPAAAQAVTAPLVEKSGENAPLPAGVLAKVGSWTLTQDEFADRIKGVKNAVKDFNENEPGAKAMLLQELVRQQLLIQEARKEKLQESQDIRSALTEFENTLLVQEIVTLWTKDITATMDDAKKYYGENPDEFKKPLEKQLREIVVATQAEANEILVQVLQNADFAQIAKDKSKAKSKDNGGDLGYKTEASFPAMAAAVSTLKKGGVSSVFEGPDGFYIVKVEDIRGGELVAFDEVKEDLVKFLKLRQQQQVLADKVKGLEQQINVQVNQDILKAGMGE